VRWPPGDQWRSVCRACTGRGRPNGRGGSHASADHPGVPIDHMTDEVGETILDALTELVTTASWVLAAAGQDDPIWGHASARNPERSGSVDQVRRVGPGGDHSGPPVSGGSRGDVLAATGRDTAGTRSTPRSWPPARASGLWCTPIRPTRWLLPPRGHYLRPVSHAANFFVTRPGPGSRTLPISCSPVSSGGGVAATGPCPGNVVGQSPDRRGGCDAPGGHGDRGAP
jgi:hypothetical protein